MSDIFVSYSHLDSDYAHRIVQVLEQHGLSAWIDERIDYGAQWPRVIQAQIDKCCAFVVIMTPRSYRSDWVHNELARARRKGKQIFPLLLEGEQWLSVETIQYVDVTGGGLPPSDFYKKLAQVVSARAVEEDGDATNTQPEPSPTLTLLLSVRPKTVEVGEEARWTVTLRNDGDVDLTQVTAKRGRTLLDRPFDLAAGRGRRFTFTTRYTAGGQRSRTVTVTSMTRSGDTVRSAAGASVYVAKPRTATTKAGIAGGAVRPKPRRT